MTLASFSEKLDERHAGKTLDAEWLRWVTQLIAKLKLLQWQYTEGTRTEGPRQHGDDQLHGLHVGLGLHVSVQSVSVPLGQPPVPGFDVDGDGYLRRSHV